jgi:anti-anti-sigma factor
MNPSARCAAAKKTPMKLSKKQIKPGLVVIEFTGRVSMGNDCLEIDRHVEEHILRDEKHLIFDLTAVHHVDSAVIGQIVKSHSRLKKSGGMLRLAGPTGMVEGVLRLTHVNKVIEIFPTATAASENFPAET